MATLISARSRRLSALVESGVRPGELSSLKAAVTPAHVRTAFTRMVERHDGTLPTSLHNIGGTLLAIAKYWLEYPEHDLTAIKSIKAKVCTTSYGMTQKNRERLAQFDDRLIRQEFYNLPFKLIAQAKAEPRTRRAALLTMRAVGMAILICAPIRAKNLAQIELNRHLRVTGKGKARRYAIWIEAEEVKNDAQLSVDLPKEVGDLISAYLDDYRPLISPTPGNALFPSLSGSARKPGSFGQEISNQIFKSTGIKVHAHLFRHLAAKLYLDGVPGDYETVRRLLAHKRLDTTLNAYASFDNRRAQERFHDFVLDARNGKRRK